jgi:hypothetical protein
MVDGAPHVFQDLQCSTGVVLNANRLEELETALVDSLDFHTSQSGSQ